MSGNGVDLGHIAVMLENVITAQGQMRADMEAGFSALRMDVAEVRAGLNEVRGGLNEVRAAVNEVRAGLNEVRGAVNLLDRRVNDLAEQAKVTQQSLVDYHGSVIGHGILISELDARQRRVEQHLGLPHTV
jgi:methyl-accepting chemotaxis protein